MNRPVLVNLALLLVLAVGCSDDDTDNQDPKKDSSITADGPVTKIDGPVTSPDGPVTSPDGPVTSPDGPVSQPDVGSTSCGTYTPVEPTTAGVALKVGDKPNIKWTKGGGAPVNIYIDRDHAGTASKKELLFAATADDGSESWTVTGPDSSHAVFWVECTLSKTKANASDKSFTITTVPTGTCVSYKPVSPTSAGVTLVPGSSYTITWTKGTGTSPVNIYLDRNHGTSSSNPTLIISNTANDGSESWTVTTGSSSEAVFRVECAADKAKYNNSNTSFFIK